MDQFPCYSIHSSSLRSLTTLSCGGIPYNTARISTFMRDIYLANMQLKTPQSLPFLCWSTFFIQKSPTSKRYLQDSASKYILGCSATPNSSDESFFILQVNYNHAQSYLVRSILFSTRLYYVPSGDICKWILSWNTHYAQCEQLFSDLCYISV